MKATTKAPVKTTTPTKGSTLTKPTSSSTAKTTAKPVVKKPVIKKKGGYWGSNYMRGGTRKMYGGATKPVVKNPAKAGTPVKPAAGKTTTTFTVGLDPSKPKAVASKFKVPGYTVTPKDIPDTPGAPASTGNTTSTFTVALDPSKPKAVASKFKIPAAKRVVATNIPDTPGASNPPASGGPAAPAPIGAPDPPGTTTQTLENGTVQKTQPDGTIREEMADGTVTETAPDGTVTTVDADGNVTAVDSEGNPVNVSQNSTSYDDSGNPIAPTGTGTGKSPSVSPGIGTGIQTTLPQKDYSRVYEYTAVPEGVDLDALDNDFSDDSVAHIANDTLFFGCVRVAGRLLCATGAGGALNRGTATEAIRKKLEIAVAGLGGNGQNPATLTPADSNKQAMLISASVESQLSTLANTLRTKTAGYTPTCNASPPATQGTCKANSEKLAAALSSLNEAQASLNRVGSAAGGGSRKKRKNRRGGSRKA